MKESDIRPDHLFQRYVELSASDGARLDHSRFVEVPCPGCGAKDCREQFKKTGFTFQVCQGCHSLYCSPRPAEAQLIEFYETSESSKYWSEVFFPAVAEARREKIFRKKAARISALLADKGIKPRSLCDVGAGNGIFLEEMAVHFRDAKLHAVEPSPLQAARCEEKGIATVASTADKATAFHGRMDFVISSEVIEHVYSPLDFTRSLCDLLTPGGHCLITGLGYEGFDILTLQEQSRSVSPPHHINFMSVTGFEQLFRRAGFRTVEVFTPGELDVEIVLKSDRCPAFLKTIQSRGDEALAAFQTFLANNRLSSHVWVFAGK